MQSQKGTLCVLLRSQIALDRSTKALCRRVQPGQIVVIDHPDLDELAAIALIEAKVRAVINTSSFLTGLYPALGAQRLLQAGLLLYQAAQPLLEPEEKTKTVLYEGDDTAIAGNQLLVRKGREWIPCTRLEPVTCEQVGKQMEEADKQMNEVLSRFLDNTLEFAIREKELIVNSLPKAQLHTRMNRRHVVVVARGKHYQEDLQLLQAYIHEMRPVLLAVDGGADALLACGMVPDLIVGDMDSLSDQALLCGAELVVQTYLDGRAPGKGRLEALGVPHVLLASPGTSEDAAMLLAFEEQAELIVTVGTHATMIDFLEKGRKGMGSTLLVRAKIGSKLIDARGISQLTFSQREAAVPVFHKPRLFESLYALVKGWRAQREQSEHRDSGI